MINRTAVTVLVFLVWASATITGAVLQSDQNFETRINGELAASRSDLDDGPPLPASPPTSPPAIPGVPTVTPNPLIIAPPPPPPPPPLPPPPVPVRGTPCLSNVSACVKLSTKQAWLINKGKVVLGPVSITSGKKGEPTPTGMHRVLWKDADHLSREFDDAPMPWSVFFASGGIAFHTGSLRAASSGCIHLSDSVAKRFFSNLSVGDAVQVLR
ncbi:L,D-transpeptidase [Pseudonocardia spinosispora]|uniref:L,D-transpeptidase n=1 Tax=Pseudonocardia spinosispora TaxID=103441 RepID=UPI00042A1321|nr:L,D-transpeptidase [Pseudonocardia spinosispora]